MKYPGTDGLKLLVVQPLNKKLEPIGILQVAADVVQAGAGGLCVLGCLGEGAPALPDEKIVSLFFWLFGVVGELEGKTYSEVFFMLKDGWKWVLKKINLC